MGQSVDVVVSELHSAAARLEDAAQRLQDGLSSVDNETTQLLGSGWKGGAASAYGPAWGKWHDGAGQVIAGLQRMSELLTIAGKEYAKTDESGARALDSTVQGSSGSSGGGAGTAAGDQAVDRGIVGANATARSTDGAQQAMSPFSQLGQTAAQSLTQAGQAVTGLVQEAAQLASGLAHDAGQGQSDQGEATAEEHDGEPEGAAATSGEQSTGIAPVESELVGPAEVASAVERRGE